MVNICIEEKLMNILHEARKEAKLGKTQAHGNASNSTFTVANKHTCLHACK